MKFLIIIFIVFAVFSLGSYCQCPASGLRIQSANCLEPKNLKVNSITCSEATISWTGNKGQTYIINASATDHTTSNIIKLKTSKITCDGSGHCGATIYVEEGSNVSWSVRTNCIIVNASVFSSELTGNDILVPYCEKFKDSANAREVHIYPNPAPGYLIVEGLNFSGSVAFQVYDVTGKKVFTKDEIAMAKSSKSFYLNLNNLNSGTYILQVTNGNYVNKEKFVVLKK